MISRTADAGVVAGRRRRAWHMDGGKTAILQSSYIPWKGYFDIINMVDLFVFYDDVQFTVRDWRSRNRIKCKEGPVWLTVPCGADRNRLICEVQLTDRTWQKKHWDTIRHCYSRASYFAQYRGFFEELYMGHEWESLSDMNQQMIKSISREIFGMTTEFDDSRRYAAAAQKGERILELIEMTGASTYVSGPSAKSYLDEAEFARRGIELMWMDYTGYPEYRQLHPPFIHEVSIIDLIFNEGPDAARYLKSACSTATAGGHV